jgi:hypothetical protein
LAPQDHGALGEAICGIVAYLLLIDPFQRTARLS